MKSEKRMKLERDLADAERRVFELRAQLASRLGAAFDALGKAESFTGSGVILQVTALGGAEVVPPVMIRDGLSPRAIAALQDDVSRSFELATLVNPGMARPRKET